MQEKVLPRGRPVPPTALGQVPLKPLAQVLGKAVGRPPGPGVPGGTVSPHMSARRVTSQLLWAPTLGAAQPYGVSLTTVGIAPASLRYDRLGPVARVAGPRCLAGNPLLGCVPASLSSVASMAQGHVYHCSHCSLGGLGPVALEYRSCHWPGRSAGLPQCVRPWGCRPLRPVTLLPWVHVRVRCPGPLGACSPVRALCAVCLCCWWFCPSSSPPTNFLVFFFASFFFVLLLCVFSYFFFFLN